MLKDLFRRISRSETEAPIELRLEQIKQRITEMAQQQAISAGVGSYWQEARRIAQSCDMFNLGLHGYDDQGLFVSLGIEMLQYEPELGYAILSQMNRLKPEVGYLPVGRLMVTLGQIESRKRSPIISRISYLRQRPELAHLIEDGDYRCQKAGKLIAVAILSAGQNVRDASHIYHRNQFDPSVKLSLDEGLKRWDAEIATKIIK